MQVAVFLLEQGYSLEAIAVPGYNSRKHAGAAPGTIQPGRFSVRSANLTDIDSISARANSIKEIALKILLRDLCRLF